MITVYPSPNITFLVCEIRVGSNIFNVKKMFFNSQAFSQSYYMVLAYCSLPQSTWIYDPGDEPLFCFLLIRTESTALYSLAN